MSSMLNPDRRSEGQVSRLEDLVKELVANIEVLHHSLAPVRSVGPDSVPAPPQEAPANRLHEVQLVLEEANRSLRSLQQEINL